MNTHRRRGTLIIFLGDTVVLAFSLWAAIAIRTVSLPSSELLFLHVLPFGLLTALSLIVFYVSGLYEPQTVVLRGKVPVLLFQASVFNALFGLGLFYFFPFVGIAPKTTLLLYLAFSFTLLLLWRIYGGRILGVRKREPAILVGGGDDLAHLVNAVDDSEFYGIEFVLVHDLDRVPPKEILGEIVAYLKRTRIETIVVDLGHPNIAGILPALQSYQFLGVHFIDQSRVYEDLFDRVPLSLIGYAWVLEHISLRAHFGYDLLKRAMDTALSMILLILSFPLYPFVALFIKLEDGGPVFLFQERVGEQNAPFTIVKFRTMKAPGSDRGKWVVKDDPRITRVGKFLRVTRIDELPQLWNVLIGDLSLIGPRPELPDLVKYYTAIIPYYNVRHLVKPGLSGWAQVHHEKPPHSVEETKEKLSYDLYYIKNRNALLDLKIALKTIRTLLSRMGV